MMGAQRDGIEETRQSGICARALRNIFREANRRRRRNDNNFTVQVRRTRATIMIHVDSAILSAIPFSTSFHLSAISISLFLM